MVTRKESKKDLWACGNINTLSKVECDAIIDKIYNDLDFRTCNNCKEFRDDELGQWCFISSESKTPDGFCDLFSNN